MVMRWGSLKNLESEDYNFQKNNYILITIIVDLISVIRKIPFQKFGCIKDALDCAWSMINIAEANQIDIVDDSYIENSIKEWKESVEYVNLSFGLTCTN